MPKTNEELTRILDNRLKNAVPYARRRVDCADEIIVFGSMALGLERPDSDIDVLCVGECDYKLKTTSLDLIGVSTKTNANGVWLHSELASHIARYGVWVKGSPQWTTDASIDHYVVAEKRRRVMAFMKGLPHLWSRFEDCFRIKYSIKMRRETQRLILLQRGVPIPPTRILDDAWDSFSQSSNDIFQTLHGLSSSCSTGFVADLLAKADEHLFANRHLSMKLSICSQIAAAGRKLHV